jgi:glycosyltransferase involved in cell wall biosynthesis
MRTTIVIPNFNSAETVVRAAEAILRQHTTHPLTVVIVDDGSTDGSVEVLTRALGARIRLVSLAHNRGRSSARNEGARATDAELLVFVDSDCVAIGTSFIHEHATAIEGGADVSFGQVCTPGDHFWDRLQRDSNTSRERAFACGDFWTFTTQNVAMTRRIFDQADGFDPVFDRHGFEDRDLFVRLERIGARVRYTPGARVTHDDRITLSSVARKLGEAGRFSSSIFRQRYPDVYSKMAYSRLDCEVRPWLRFVDRALTPLAMRAARGPARWLNWRWLPFALRAAVARSVYGLCYLHGTVQGLADRQEGG